MYIDYKNALESRIKTLSAIRTVDWYNDQYDRYEDLKTIALPACYIEFENPIQWVTNGDGLQTAQTEIRLHLVVFDVADSPNPSLELANDLHKTIHSHSLFKDNEQLSTELVRTSSALKTEYDQLKIIVLSYATTLYDTTTLRRYIEARPTFVLKQNT